MDLNAGDPSTSTMIPSKASDRLRRSFWPPVWLLIFGHIVTAWAAEWKEVPHYRSASLAVPAEGRAGYTSLPGSLTGILFTNSLSEERGLTNGIFMSGSGVAAGDVDGDGWCDLYLGAVDSPNALYRNRGGWKFENITTRAGVACTGQPVSGVALADADGDRDLDLFVGGIGFGIRLFLNDGHGRFREVTQEAGLASRSAAMTMALADIDRDGDLDLYVANYRSSSLQDEFNVRFRVATVNQRKVVTAIDGRPATPEEVTRYEVSPGNQIIETGEPDALYRNDGRGRFQLVSWTDGTFLDEDGQALTEPPRDWSYTAMFRDWNGDGAPDLYVCSDNDSEDRMWVNDGHGRFRALPRLAVRHTSLSSMGVDFADIDRDGRDEFFVADMLSRDHRLRQKLMTDRRPLHPVGLIDNRPQYTRNTLFWNRGDGTYAELGQFAGVEASEWSWSPVFVDVDLDGFEDLLITTGLERSLRDADARRFLEVQKRQAKLTKREFLELRKIMPRLEPPNVAFRNHGDRTFTEMSEAWGFDSREVSHGQALADLDNDGDLDVVVNTLNGPALVYRSETTAPRVAVRLRGSTVNTHGIGARLEFTGGPVSQSHTIIQGGRYLSSDDPMRVFATGTVTQGLHLTVTWPSGNLSELKDIRPNRIYEIQETGAVSLPRKPVKSPPTPTPWFRDVSDRLGHVHFERPFNDFQRQLLLPRQYSQLGPGVSWCDWNGDGRDDLLIGCGREGSPAVLLNDGQSRWQPIVPGDGLSRLPGDTSTLLGIPLGDATALLVGVSNYETADAAQPSVLRMKPSARGATVQAGLPGGASSVGPMAVADIDADGDLDLFVGGRLIAGHYPEPASSHLYRGEDEEWRLDRRHEEMFGELGLVSGAVFTDLDADGYPELALACEWGPPRIWANDHGTLTEATDRFGLDAHHGWWNSITAGDFDEDGRMDLVAGNWGNNGRYRAYASHPLRAWYGDANEDGSVQFLETYKDPVLAKDVPWRHWDTLAMAMPWIQERFQGFTALSEAGAEEILGPRQARMLELKMTTSESMLFLNRGDHFEIRPLPWEAQLAPVFGISVADLDGDGHQDLFLAQNFFDVHPETARYDAGRGLVLRGDGQGNFAAVPGDESGIKIYGEQRGAAWADYDGDGRVDLAVAQNGAATKLYRNERSRSGVRVRLEGPPGNRAGIGVQLRAQAETWKGPIHEVHAGAGYWSQDSVITILHPLSLPCQFWTRWPGGKVRTVVIPAETREIVLKEPDQIAP